MKLKMAGMLQKYGVPIKVWSAKSLDGESKVVDGIPVKTPTASVEPEYRFEPIVPYNSFGATWIAAAAGKQVNVDLLWFSTGKYVEGTVVEIPSQGGKYIVTNVSDYTDYSDTIKYELKGDDHNQSNL